MAYTEADIKENELLAMSPEILDILLKDHTTQCNIFWATDSYSHLGKGFAYSDQITAEKITSGYGK